MFDRLLMSQTEAKHMQGQPMHGISQASVEILLNAFANTPEIVKVILYGSRAKGNFRQGSDIDMTLDAPALSYAQVTALAAKLDDSQMPYKVDLSRLQDIQNPALLEHIQRVGQIFYSRSLS